MPKHFTHRRIPLRSGRRQAGITLVEVLVGTTLGMLVSAALLLLFANASANGQNVQRAGIDIENGRYTAEMLRDEIQLAGYMGEVVNPNTAFSTPDPCSTDASTAGFRADPLTLPTAVRGYAAADALDCLATRFRQPATDALAVRRLQVSTVKVADLVGANAQYYLQTSFCTEDPPLTVIVFSRTAADFTLRNRACTAPNPVRAYVSRLYFVANCNNCGRDTTPTLKRLDLVDGRFIETPLVEGIEHFRLEYGFDTDGNGSTDLYDTAPASAGPASLWQNVTTLRVHYIVRSTRRNVGTSTAGAQQFTLGAAGNVNTPDDGFVRRAYTTTIRLVNPSSVREVP